MTQRFGRDYSRRDMLRFSAGGAGAALLAGVGRPGFAAAQDEAPTPTPPPDRQPAEGRATVIEVYEVWSGDLFKTFGALADAFEQSQPDIGVKIIYAAGDDDKTTTKTFAAIAAGQPPDLAWVDGGDIASWVVQGALEPLDELIAGVGLSEADFWAPSWRKSLWDGQVYALPLTSDANFAFLWNKQIFREVGLDPERAPATLDEMTAMNDQIAIVDGDRITRLGIIPWTVYGSPNSMLTWGWAFGGDFYDVANQKVTADNPNNIAALEWMVENYAKKYDPTQISAFQSGFGSNESNPLYQGQTAMAPIGSWELANIAQYAPNLEFGLAPMPTGPNATAPATWVGGWSVGIPKGAKNREAAFQFLNFIAGNGGGVEQMAQRTGFFPGYQKAAYFAEVVDQDPTLGQFVEILREAQHVPPPMPAWAFYSQALGSAVDDAVLGEKSPQDALAEATQTSQRELDRVLRRAGG